MAMFSAVIDEVTVSAVQDLFHLKAGAGSPIIIHSLAISQRGMTAAEALRVRLKRQTGTVTQGSGGSTSTPKFLGPTSVSSGVTVHANDTTQASAGTIDTLVADTWQLLNGLIWIPVPETRITIAAGTGFIVDLATAPSVSSTMKVSGTVKWEEPNL